jgi:CitMHS family citrate-Mg2+:H+ or citrate-Ca2+:H+ symporter
MDVVLVFFTATLFMAIVSESGGITYAVRATLKHFGRRRLAALLILMIIVLIPGALTGAGSVSLLVVGAPVAMALDGLGVPKKKITAILFITAGLSAAAPPVNIWAMVLCAGTAIPYVGFELPLGIPVLVLGAFTVIFLGWKKEGGKDIAQALDEMPEAPKGMRWWRVALPFIVFFGLVIAYRVKPFAAPIFGLALEFVLASFVAWALSPRKIDILAVSRVTVRRLLPLLSSMVVIGMLQQVMTATGVRGLLSYAVISIPLALLFILFPVIIPFSEGVLTYGGAAIIGIPLIWYLDSLGYHATVVIAGLSLLWPLGDGLPPTALIGRLSLMVTDNKESYRTFLKSTWVPWLVITAVGLLMVIFSAKLAFLVKWSM